MARSDEAQAFFHAVYSAAQQIPYGKVTTYAHLAYLVGTRTFLPEYFFISLLYFNFNFLDDKFDVLALDLLTST